MNIPNMPKDVETILETLYINGFEGYIVGGCVRDSIMGIKPHDWDMTTSATPLEMKEIFPHTVDTGIKHGTITVVMNKENYEITTYRVEGEYKDCRHPSTVSFTRDLHEDLLRRDFTVNAIAYSPKEGYVDVFGGVKDIAGKLIKGVGVASERFQEDALRMLRAVRFSVQLDFDIEDMTFLALQNNAYLIQNISVERIREELTKTLLGAYVERIDILWESGLMEFIYPEIQGFSKADIASIKNQLKAISKKTATAFAIILQYLKEDEYKAIVKSLKFDTKTKKIILSILKNLPKKVEANELGIRKMASRIGIESLRCILEIKNGSRVSDAKVCLKILNKIEEDKQCISISQLSIDGKDLFAIGIEKGTVVGEALEYGLDLVINDQSLNKKEILLEKIKNKFS